MSLPAHSNAPNGQGELLQFATECLAMARIQAQVGETFAEAGDLTGLTCATRRLVAYTRALVDTVRDFQEQQLRGVR